MVLSAESQANNPNQNESDAQAWLGKIRSAAQILNYSGTFIFQQENRIRTSRVTHLYDGKTEREKFEILDGKPRETIRNNQEIVSYVPEIKMLLVERRATQDVFPAIVPASPASLSAHYRVRTGETGRVAGFESQAIILEPKDHLRYGYKLWAELSSGLLLKAQTLNERNEVVEQIAFTQVAIGEIDPVKIQPSYTDVKSWRIERVAPSTVALTGWEVKAVPPGFKKIREMKRVVADTTTLAGNRAGDVTDRVAPREVVQIVYSDGLAAISVFVEPISKNRTEGAIRQGALNMLGKRQGDFWLTIVGEVPAAAIKQVASSIEFIAR
ncbi:MAG: MucB/RseB C-terminal domain-containing protein [Pseudomonadota bacterium]